MYQKIDHLSRLESNNTGTIEEIKESFPDEKLLAITINTASVSALSVATPHVSTPWYADIVNFLVSKIVPCDMNYQQKRRFFHIVKQYYWDDPYLFKICPDQIMRKCIPEEEQQAVLLHCHAAPYGGHFGSQRTAAKVLQSVEIFYCSYMLDECNDFPFLLLSVRNA